MTILVSNWKDGSVLHHSLVIIKGEITSLDNGTLSLSVNGEQDSSWNICNGLFCALVSLKTGANHLSLRAGPDRLNLKLALHYLNRRHFVRLVYLVCADSEGCFQGPPEEDCSVGSAKSRITFGARLLQSVTAETIRSCGLPPRTFSLEEDVHGQIDCHVFRTKLSTAETHVKTEQELWDYFALELMRSGLKDDRCKFLAFLSSTRFLGLPSAPESFSQVRSRTLGHVALGGGGLALLGTACLYTWANHLAEFQSKIQDSRPVDSTHFMDDSCNRGTLWSCYASSLGATLHELGHAFNQGHTARGLMGLGFHQMQQQLRPFPESKCCVCSRNSQIEEKWFANSNPTPGGPQLKGSWKTKENVQLRKACPHCPDGPFWSHSAALLLFYHRWFNLVENEDAMSYQVTLKGVTATSDQGIAVVEVRDVSGLVLSYWHPGRVQRPPPAIQVLRRSLPYNSHTLLVQDTAGCLITIKLDDYLESTPILKPSPHNTCSGSLRPF